MEQPLNEQAGLRGVVFQTKKVVSDVEGLFGVSFSKDINVIYYVRNPLGAPISNINIQASWAGGSANIVDFDPSVVYDDKYPEGVVITITVTNSNNRDTYQPATILLTVPAGGFRVIDLTLQFREAYARITKKRYL